MAIYTVGYSGISADELEALVRRRQALLMDVRLKPYSRRKGFDKFSLQRRLGSAYIHASGLGNINYRGGDVKLLDPFPWIEQIAKLQEEGCNVVLMCICKEVEGCHRKQVCELLEARGLTVEHLHPGKKTDEQTKMF